MVRAFLMHSMHHVVARCWRCPVLCLHTLTLTLAQRGYPQGVANRDIKLENTLLDGSPRPLVKICDFGYSKVDMLSGNLTLPAPGRSCATDRVQHTGPTLAPSSWWSRITHFRHLQHEKFQSAPGSRVGTPAYLAPEVIMTTRGQTYDGKVPFVPFDSSCRNIKPLSEYRFLRSQYFCMIYNASPLPEAGARFALQIADIWSCGVMLYVMLVGAYPFERPEDKHDNQKLQKMIQVSPFPHTIQ